MACYSFYGNKPITTGEGGMLCGDFGNAREWRDGGFDAEYRVTVPGLNYRMSNMQAAVGLAQLERFDQLLSARLRNSSLYEERIPGRGKWLFVAQTVDPVGLKKYLYDRGVDTRPVFTPLHRCPAFRPYAAGLYKYSDKIWESGICLPTGPHVTPEQVDAISVMVNQFNKDVKNNGTEHLRKPSDGGDSGAA